MPKIPLYVHEVTPSGPVNVRANPGMLDGQMQAAQRLGDAVANIGEKAFTLADKLQRADNFRRSSAVELAMQDEFEKFQSSLDVNSDERKWSGDLRKKLDDRVAPLLNDIRDKNAREEAKMRLELFKVRQGGEIDQQAKQVGIKKAGVAGKAVVDLAWQNGDEETAVRELNRMADLEVIFRESIPGEIQKGRELMAKTKATTALNDLRNLPPAKAKGAMMEFSAALTSKDDKAVTEKFGALTMVDRIKLADESELRAREVQRTLDVNARRLVSEVRAGRATLDSLAQAVTAGELDEDTARAIRPDVDIALGERAERVAAKEQAAADKAAAEQRRIQNEKQGQNRRFEQMMGDVAPLGKMGTVGERDIATQLSLGEITPDQAEQLRARLANAATYEQASTAGEFASLKSEISGLLTGRLFGAKDPEPSVYSDVLGRISSAKLTQASRLKLVDQVLMTRQVDIADLEEGQASSWFDRSITPAEREVRRDVIRQLRAQLSNIGVEGTGDAFFATESRIRDFFDSASDGKRSLSEIEAFKSKLSAELQQAAGNSILSSVFD